MFFSDKIGPTMFVLRQDVHQNIQRLEKLHDSDPSLYSNMVEILKKERNEGSAKKGPSCSKALVWLTR
nr:glycolipid transfer protein 3-like [Ipomoea batatas]